MPRPKPPRRSAKLIRDFLAADDGVTAIELGFLAPIFLGASLMLVELGLYELYAASLSYTTQKAARQVMTGQFANGADTSITSFINNSVCASLAPPMTCDRVVVNSTVLTSQSTPQGASAWWTLMNAAQTNIAPPAAMDNTKTTFCIGASGSTVALEVYYAMPFFSIPILGTPSTMFKGGPVIWIASTAAFRNEPFTTTYTGC
jgi:Flp pilus assembly protein TadG